MRPRQPHPSSAPCRSPQALSPRLAEPVYDPLAMDELDDPEALLLDRERALVGAALLEPAAGDLLLAELSPRDLICSVAEAVLRSLKALRDEEPVRYATEPALGLVLEDLELSGVLRRLEELGGRAAVEALVVDRPELREAREALRAAAARMPFVEEEPLVQLAAVELNALPPTRSATP
jgi:hypothetical protein